MMELLKGMMEAQKDKRTEIHGPRPILSQVNEAGRRALTSPDPQLKGAWYPGGFNPCTYQVKTRFQNVPFKRSSHCYNEELLSHLAQRPKVDGETEMGYFRYPHSRGDKIVFVSEVGLYRTVVQNSLYRTVCTERLYRTVVQNGFYSC
jgi:hypothetical protein